MNAIENQSIAAAAVSSSLTLTCYPAFNLNMIQLLWECRKWEQWGEKHIYRRLERERERADKKILQIYTKRALVGFRLVFVNQKEVFYLLHLMEYNRYKGTNSNMLCRLL